jgi:hypothetical protein
VSEKFIDTPVPMKFRHALGTAIREALGALSAWRRPYVKGFPRPTRYPLRVLNKRRFVGIEIMLDDSAVGSQLTFTATLERRANGIYVVDWKEKA